MTPRATSTEPLRTAIEEAARALGFDAVGVCTVDAAPQTAERLARFIADGHHGGMDWIAETAARRSSPRALWPEARTAIMVAHSYAPQTDPMARLEERHRGIVSAYAKGRDYHDVIKGRLKTLAGRIAALTDADVKVFVDTAPLMEKPLAAAAGIGWQGKHTNLVSRQHGSWLFLGAILTSAEVLPLDVPHADRCGSCRRCLDACPTDAFPGPYRLDARRCLAYLSIEHKGQIPLEFRKPMANRVFGCDDCLAVCPWNSFASRSREVRYAARPETDDPPIAELVALDDAAFRQRFAGTPVKRTGRDRIVRNALIAAGNSKDRSLIPRILERIGDGSPLVRGMAVWALGELDAPEALEVAWQSAGHCERDAGVLEEWRRLGRSVEPAPQEDVE